MLSGIKSHEARMRVRFGIWKTINNELDDKGLTLEEKEELVKWYEDNLVVASKSLRDKLEQI